MIDDFKILKKQFDNDSLHININSQRINFNLNTFKYRDKDTRQIVFYIPSLELTSYGATEEKATEMIKFSIDDYFTFLLTLPTKKLQKELSSLNWNQSILKNKEYSKAYVDVSGQLKNFNAVGDKVERLTLVAA